MLSYGIFLIIFAAGGALSGYAGSSTGNNIGNGAGGYGFSGSYSGGGPPPNFPSFPGFNFPALLSSYLDSFQKYHQQFINTHGGGKGGGSVAYSHAHSSPNAKAQAMSSLTFDNVGLQDNLIRAQAGYGGPGGYPGASGFGGINSYGDPLGNRFGGGGAGGFANGASASASIGPDGIHQTANVFPENPTFPNVNTRFGGTPGGSHYSVFTSSASHTSNINGKPQTVQEAQTTVNDNGKITTYTAKRP